ncbi:MAG: beta-ketoacyl-[acyl-carrier-protein] synthase family protein [Armatimonadetes bacterium]|nr:beta-ketoacyl-[acyl-carrier-protein] synthase family protein [Armatimonadota bacterium]
MSAPSERNRRRVVVTGTGVVTCLGTGLEAFWQGLVEGRSGIARLTKFDPTGLRNEKGGQVRDWTFDPSGFGLEGPPDEATQFLLTSAREALDRAGLTDHSFDPSRAGMVLSTNFGGGMSWEEHIRRRLAEQPSNHTFPEASFHTPLVHLARVFGLRGPGQLLSVACASGTAAIGCALETIRHGRADVMLAGGHDSLTPSCLAGLSILATMTRDEIRPFSADRSGTLFGEGAAALVIEDLDHALARGAEPLAEALGAWQTNNAYHLTAPDKGARGMTRVLAEAIVDAGTEPTEIDYVNAHGTGTQAHDPEETHAIKAVLGEHAYRVPVSSIKAAIAHTMGAAGACEAVATVQTLRTGIVPPTLNYQDLDPECDLDYVPNVARAAEVKCAASMSAGVGGSNACVVLRAFPPSPFRRGAGGEAALLPSPERRGVGGEAS